ncbi:uncharacterized protein LOC144755272 isoform X2 [Lissotriton helveticus]
MKTRKEISQRRSDQAPVTFCDVVACFSEEEWTLLHHWQKELYNNVMQEINQALSSLGPLIATSVFSLRPKEKEDAGLMGHQKSNIQGVVKAEKDVLFKKTRKGNQNPNDFQDMNEDENENHNEPCDDQEEQSTKAGVLPGSTATSSNIKREGESFSMDCLYPFRRESITSDKRPEDSTLMSSIGINEEGETYPLDVQECRKRARINSISGGGETTIRQSKDEDYVKYVQKSLPCKSFIEKAHMKMTPASKMATTGRFQLLSETQGDLGVQSFSNCETSVGTKNHSSVCQETLRGEMSQKHNVCESNLWNTQAYESHAVTHKNWGSYAKLPDSEKGLHQNFSFAEQQRVQDQIPLENLHYQCKECDKSFSHKGHLICHERTHSRQRPYQCTECEKSFSQKHHLIGHQRTHLGGKPFQCTKCHKIFSWRESLHRHYKTHTGERPHHCVKCNKRFSRREGLIRHLKTHMNNNPPLIPPTLSSL